MQRVEADKKSDLTGRVALVTGGSGGIGSATATLLAAHGAFLGIHCHSNAAAADAVLDVVRQQGGKGLVLQADLTQEDQVNAAVDQLVQATGRLDIVVNNAGSPVERTAIENCSVGLWRKVFDVNMTSAFMVTRRAIPHLKRSGRGCIVNVLSLSTRTGGANGAGPYAAAKGALEVFTRTLARELAPQVRTNSICPGVIETPHHEQFSTPERMQQYRRETPLQRNGSAEEVAATILFLVSDAASFINGALLDINGGRFLR